MKRLELFGSLAEKHALAIKTVKQNYQPTQQILLLLEEFRQMVNDCIRLGLEKGVTSRNRLMRTCYHDLKRYGLHSWYSLYAVSVAACILKTYRKALRKKTRVNRPYSSKLMAQIGSLAFKIDHDYLRIPIRPRRYELIKLNDYTLRTLSNSLKVGSVTLTPHTINIAFYKETIEVEPSGYMGIDRNLDNVTAAVIGGETHRYDLSKITLIKGNYRQVKSHFKRNDIRIMGVIFHKYGMKQRNRTSQILHHVSKKIVHKAKEERLGIVMERLTGMRGLYRKGNGQGRSYRARMNSWSYAELQRQIEYKAKWEGIKVIYVPAGKTSSTCAICGSKILECAGREVICPKCGTSVDRDANAARNIAARGLRFGPVALPSEVMKGNVEEPLILGVDGSELTHDPKS